MRTLIKNGTLVTAAESYPADLLLADGRIVLMGQDLPAEGAEVVDARGKFVLPGAIDVHTHLELPFGGTVASDDFYSGHKAAAFGGTTTHIDFCIQDRLINRAFVSYRSCQMKYNFGAIYCFFDSIFISYISFNNTHSWKRIKVAFIT